MRTFVAILSIAILTTACQKRESSTGIEPLEAEFSERLTQAVSKSGESLSVPDVQAIAIKVAQAVFGPHPEVLKAEAARRLAKMPKLPPAELDGYELKTLNDKPVEMTDFAEIRGQGKATLLLRGWQPEFVFFTSKQMFLAQILSPEEMGPHLVLSSILQPKIRVVKTGEVTTLAQKHINDYILFDLKLTDQGVFEPVRIRWMVKAAESNKE